MILLTGAAKLSPILMDETFALRDDSGPLISMCRIAFPIQDRHRLFPAMTILGFLWVNLNPWGLAWPSFAELKTPFKPQINAVAERVVAAVLLGIKGLAHQVEHPVFGNGVRNRRQNNN